MKAKGKRHPSKPRFERVYATTADHVEEISLSVDPKRGVVHFGPAVTNSYGEVSYQRPRGAKILTRTPLAGPGLQLDPNDGLLSNYDVLVAVDTNTRQVAAQRISVTGIVVGVRARCGEALAYRTPFCLELVDVAEEPERIGWMMAIRELREQRIVQPEARVGMIVDADLGRIPAYNSRELPLYRAFFLPDWIQLIYASADVGRTYLANKLIQMADRASRQVLDCLRAGKAPLNSHALQGLPYRGYRRVVGRASFTA